MTLATTRPNAKQHACCAPTSKKDGEREERQRSFEKAHVSSTSTNPQPEHKQPTLCKTLVSVGKHGCCRITLCSHQPQAVYILRSYGLRGLGSRIQPNMKQQIPHSKVYTHAVRPKNRDLEQGMQHKTLKPLTPKPLKS